MPRTRPFSDGRWLTVSVIMALGILAGACVGLSAVSPSAVSEADRETVGRFVAELRRGSDADYTPLVDVDDAVERAALIVVGSVVGVGEGVTIDDAEGLAMRMMTLEVAVDDVVVGPSLQAGNPVAVQVFASAAVDPARLRASIPKTRAIFVLSDITEWVPFAGAKITYPDVVAPGTRLYTPFVDGVVFDGADGLVSMLVESEAVIDGWAGPSTFDELIDRLAVAAER